MADLGENLRTFLLGSPAVASMTGGRVHQNYVPDTIPEGRYVWFTRRTVVYDDCLDTERDEPLAELYDVEVWGRSLGEVQELAQQVRSRLHRHGVGIRGNQFGDQLVQVINVTDHEDDYVARGGYEDRPMHVASFDVEIVPRY